jgi:hypothetical protein
MFARMCVPEINSQNEPLFNPHEDLLEMNKKNCQEIT